MSPRGLNRWEPGQARLAAAVAAGDVRDLLDSQRESQLELIKEINTMFSNKDKAESF